MVNLLYLTIPVCRGAELSGLRGVARRRSVRREGHGLRRGSALGGGADPKERLHFTRRPRAGDKNAAHNKFFRRGRKKS